MHTCDNWTARMSQVRFNSSKKSPADRDVEYTSNVYIWGGEEGPLEQLTKPRECAVHTVKRTMCFSTVLFFTKHDPTRVHLWDIHEKKKHIMRHALQAVLTRALDYWGYHKCERAKCCNPCTIDVKMVAFLCPQVTWQFQTTIFYPAVQQGLIQ